MVAQEVLFWHTAPVQIMVAPQVLAQPPQFWVSVTGLTHLPAQQRKVLPEHLVPQTPQLL